MEMLDATILSTALPTIAKDLAVSPVTLSLAITAYVLSLAIFIPISGWIADKFGARRVFISAIGVFLIGSIYCGLSDSLLHLVSGRVFQGMGGAMMTPVARLIVLRSVPKGQLIDAMAWMVVPALIGPVLGPPLGGLIVDTLDWRWVFWINLPVGLIGMYLAYRFVPDIEKRDPGPFDIGGFLLLSIGLVSLIAGLESVGRSLVPPYDVILLLGVGFLLVALYVRRALKQARPVVDVRLMSLPTFRASVVGGLFFRIGVGAMPFLLPLSLQLAYGYSALDSGLVTFGAALGAIIMKPYAGPILGRFGFRNVLVFNGLISAALIGVLGLPDPAAAGPWLIVAFLVIGGLSRSLQFTAMNAIAYAEIDEARMSKSTSFSAMTMQLSFAVGIAIASGLLHLLTEAETPLRSEFVTAFIVIGGLMAISALVFATLPGNAGADMAPKPTKRRERLHHGHGRA